MEKTIKTEKGIFEIKCYEKDYKIEMFDLDEDHNILYVEFSSDFFNLKDKHKIERHFKELESKIIQIMKFFINENIEFYKHFDINFTLINDYANCISKGDNKYFHIIYPKFLKAELKNDSLEYLKGMTDEQKRNVYGFSKTCNFQYAT